MSFGAFALTGKTDRAFKAYLSQEEELSSCPVGISFSFVDIDPKPHSISIFTEETELDMETYNHRVKTTVVLRTKWKTIKDEEKHEEMFLMLMKYLAGYPLSLNLNNQGITDFGVNQYELKKITRNLEQTQVLATAIEIELDVFTGTAVEQQVNYRGV